jgi:hypothetical protein
VRLVLVVEEEGRHAASMRAARRTVIGEPP